MYEARYPSAGTIRWVRDYVLEDILSPTRCLSDEWLATILSGGSGSLVIPTTYVVSLSIVPIPSDAPTPIPRERSRDALLGVP